MTARKPAHAIDPLRLSALDSPTLEQEAAESLAIQGTIAHALIVTPDPTQAVRVLLFALGLLAEDSSQPREVLDAMIGFLREHRDSLAFGEGMARMFATARGQDVPPPGWKERVLDATHGCADERGHQFTDDNGNRVYLFCQRGCGARDPLEPEHGGES